jgi:hypothetical protein
MSIPDDVLQTMKPLPYAKAREQVRDGDLLFCSAHDPFSRLIRWATRSPWSHVAIAFHIKAIDRVMVLESVERIGVRVVPLSTFISRTSGGQHPYPGRILLARHRGIDGRRASAQMKPMAEFGFDRLGDRFAQGEMIKIILRIVLGRFDVKLPKGLGPRDEFICSELVARCYERIGLKFPWDGLGFIGPGDIAKSPEVVPIAQIRTR